MVICTIPIRLYGEFAGSYRRGDTDPRDRLAALYPEYFQPEYAKLVPPAESQDADPPPEVEATKTNKRRKP